MSVVEDSSVGVAATAEAGTRSSFEDTIPPTYTTASSVAVVEELAEEPPADPYFWEEGGNSNLDWWSKVRHALHFGGIKAIEGAEAVGEVVANTLGLSESKYQYVIDALEVEEIRKRREERDEEDRRQMALALERVESEAHIVLQDQEAQVGQGAVEVDDARVTLPPNDDTKLTNQADGRVDDSAIANIPMG